MKAEGDSLLLRMRRLTLLAVFAVQLAGGAVALGPVTTVHAATPLPDCRYDDILTARREYSQWDQSVLDPIFMLPKLYSPNDLVSVGQANLTGSGKVRRLALDDLKAMAKSAAEAGKPIAVQSAYRSYSSQKSIFNSNVRRSGFRAAALVSARPGHSEHQLGTTIDFKSKGGKAPWNVGDWGQSPAGSWMKDNAWKFGWIMSYPKGKSPGKTCYRYEPWHYRYFGRDVARRINESGLSSREWLWREGYGSSQGGDPEPPAGAPSTPANLAGEALGDRRVRLTWAASEGGTGTVRYNVFRNGIKVGSTTDTTYVDRPNKTKEHEYRLRAVDADKKRSSFTETVRVTSF